MKHCEVCGNEYEKAFEIKMAVNGERHWFDSFECAIHRLAPVCLHCGVRVVGHGVELGDRIFCGAHCARQSGFIEFVDRSQKWISQRGSER